MNILMYFQKQDDKNDNNGNKRHDAAEKLNVCIHPLTLLGRIFNIITSIFSFHVA